MSGWSVVRSVGLAVMTMLVVSEAKAQTNAEVNAAIQFNFSTPGAKSLGLGAAFVGLANDATAAYANPAGLTALASPEVSIEGRRIDSTHVFTDAGRLGGQPTGMGIDTLSGLVEGKAKSTVTSPAYLSFVYPGDGWALALYRHELANIDAHFDTTGAFLDDPSGPRLAPSRNAINLKIESFGLAGAYRLRGGLSIGLGVSFNRFDLSSRTERFDIIPGSDPTAPGGLYGPPVLSENNIRNIQTQRGEGTDIGVNAGLSWEASDHLRLGLVYRQGSKFEIRGQSDLATGQVFSDISAPFKVPDILAAGLAVRATPDLIVTLDYDRVRYSQLTKGLKDIFGIPSFAAELDRFEVKDAGEIHLGAEYSLHLLSLRTGAWYDPDHRLRFTGNNIALRALFRPGDDEIHYAAGLGYRLGERAELNAGFDLSKRAKTASLSFVASFPPGRAQP